MILGCRVSNSCFKGAPTVNLATGDSFDRLDCEGNEPAHVSGVDVEAAFYSIGLPEEMREYFGMGPARDGAASA